MQAENSFSYSTQPHAAPMKRKTKYRDDSDLQNDSGLANLMHDPRVVRGNTYSARLMSSSLKTETPGIKKSKSDTRRKFTSKRSSTPPAVNGRMHMDMQTEDFLEELTDKPIEIDAETQTQAFMDRPASPLFIPARTGQDMVTQIQPGDLFDFDLEVEPILEVLVGKTLHVAMLELMQEEELEAIYRQQEEFELIRKIELAEVQRLEAEARRKALEKERRIEQGLMREAEKKILEEKIAAQYFAQQYLGSLHIGVFDMLEDQGHFYDPLQKEIEEQTMVELLNDLRIRSECYEAARAMADELIVQARLKAKLYEEQAIILRQIAIENKIRDEQEAIERKIEADLLAVRLAAEAEENAEFQVENDD